MENSPSAVAATKATLNAVRGVSVRNGLDEELVAFEQAFTTEDMREGTTAFLAKRAPRFAGHDSR
jgi:enoyl-CoA hydratase